MAIRVASVFSFDVNEQDRKIKSFKSRVIVLPLTKHLYLLMMKMKRVVSN